MCISLRGSPPDPHSYSGWLPCASTDKGKPDILDPPGQPRIFGALDPATPVARLSSRWSRPNREMPVRATYYLPLDQSLEKSCSVDRADRILDKKATSPQPIEGDIRYPVL